ncbi:MAG TPA: HAD hydrolase family protein [Blastocatellia bacterium]|nr:HAD hydrolase family protein [Blastocatellia bacterium]
MTNLTEEILERARRIKMLVLDCDGVLTDGRLILLPDGEETKAFDIKDGHAMRMAPRVGLRISIISGNKSFAVRDRARNLEVAHLYEGAWVKLGPYEEILSAENLKDEEACYVGDDVVDIPVLRRAGLAIAVADAVEEVKQFSHLVTKRKGGRGAVREVIEMILKAQGRWDEALARYIT